ncbi:MAG: methionyl-tRNA formyltransferase [Acidobacteria bacterium]|nr:methionyl-tRNA formyltransferase [Acidobacteriota bacterium]
MNLIFCGTPQFAVPTLEKLLAEKFNFELVITNPDEPSGRGYELKPPPVKQVAEKAGLKIFQPAKMKDPATREFLSEFHPDAMVVVAYGHIIPPWMIELPRVGCINLHASLLPKYRGAAPIQWSLIHGERTTGVTTMLIDPGMDTGDVLLQRQVEVRDDDTTETLSERLGALGADLMVETLRGLERGEITPHPQDHAQATLAPMLKKEHGRINWSLPAQEIAWRVRGLRPWPGAYTTFRGKMLHIWAALPAIIVGPTPSEPSELFVEPGKLLVACGAGTILQIQELQLEGRKRISARDFINGVRLTPGEKVGA